MQMVCRELDSIAQKSTFTCPSETAAWKIKGNEKLSIRNPIFTTGKKYYLITAVQTITLPTVFRSTFECKYSVVQQEEEQNCGHLRRYHKPGATAHMPLSTDLPCTQVSGCDFTHKASYTQCPFYCVYEHCTSHGTSRRMQAFCATGSGVQGHD